MAYNSNILFQSLKIIMQLSYIYFQDIKVLYNNLFLIICDLTVQDRFKLSENTEVHHLFISIDYHLDIWKQIRFRYNNAINTFLEVPTNN